MLSAGAVVTFVVLFDLGQVSRALLRLRIGHLALAATIFMGSYLVRSLRWLLLLRPLGRYPYGQVRDVLLTGFMVNNILPARLGELARALVLWRVAGASRRSALSTVGLERLCDGAVLIGLLSLVGLLFDVPAWARQLGRVTTVLLVVLLGLMAWMAYHHRSLLRAVDRGLALVLLPPGARQRVVAFLERFAPGTGALREPRLLVGVLLLSVLVWSMEVSLYFTMLRGFGIGLPLWVAALTLVVTNFGIAVPSAPGHVGVYEAACSGALIAVGLDKELALSYAIGLHLMMYVCITGFGLAAMWHLGLGLSQVTRQRAEPHPSQEH